MANELFKRSQRNFGGGFTSEKGFITPNNGLSGVLMTTIGIQYAQRLSRFYDLGDFGQVANVYHVSGPAEGQLTPQHILGPAKSMMAYYTNFSDVCQADENSLELIIDRGLCDVTGGTGIDSAAAGKPVRLEAKFCTLRSVNFTLSVQDFLIQSGSMLEFSGLEYED